MKTKTKKIKRVYNEHDIELITKKDFRKFLGDCYKEIFELVGEHLNEDIINKLSVLEQDQTDYNIDCIADSNTSEVQTYLESKEDYFQKEVLNYFDKDIDDKIYEIEKEGYKVIKCTSLAEEMKVEQFISELAANPYQLKLIA